MTRYIRTSCASLALALAVPAPAFAKDPPLKVTAGAAAKGVRSVVVGAFNIGFIFESVDRGKTTGGMIGAFGGVTRAKSKLVGVTPQMMQAVTDAAYADFTSQLTSRGYTVTDSASLFASGEMAKAKDSKTPYEVTVQLEKTSKGDSFYFKPTALAKQYFLPGDVTMNQGGMFSGFAAMGPAMQAAQVSMAMAAYAKASNQAVVDVTYLIDFSQMKRPGAFSFGGLKVNSGMAVVDEYSKLTVITPAGKTATIMIKQPVAVEGEFAQIADATKDKGAQTAMNIASGVGAVFGLGGMGIGKSRTYEFTVNSETYPPGAIKAATLANTLVADQLAALR